jgi:2-oxo-hept-3-ene-1,7-dioate hydratase
VLSVLDDHAVADAARRLLAAERSRQPIRQLSLQYPDMTVEDAYRVQRAMVAAKLGGMIAEPALLIART